MVYSEQIKACLCAHLEKPAYLPDNFFMDGKTLTSFSQLILHEL